MALTLNVYVKSTDGQPIEGARVFAYIPASAAINPPTRLTSGDGGANLYFQGPPLHGQKVTILVDAAGYRPWCNADPNGDVTPIDDGVVNVEARLVPFA